METKSAYVENGKAVHTGIVIENKIVSVACGKNLVADKFRGGWKGATYYDAKDAEVTCKACIKILTVTPAA